MPYFLRYSIRMLVTVQLAFSNNVLGQNSSTDFGKFPSCAQQYLEAAEPPECNYGYTTATDDCLCSNTGNFLADSVTGIGANCGCDILTTCASLLVEICEAYAGSISMTQDQLIVADSACSSASVSASSPIAAATTTSSPASPATASSAPTGQVVYSTGGLDTDGKISIVFGVIATTLGIMEIIGRYKTGRWLWFLCCGSKRSTS